MQNDRLSGKQVGFGKQAPYRCISNPQIEAMWYIYEDVVGQSPRPPAAEANLFKIKQIKCKYFGNPYLLPGN